MMQVTHPLNEPTQLSPVPNWTIKAPEPGVYYDMPAEEYHAIDALNATTLGAFVKSGLHGEYHLSQRTEPSGALWFGSAMHAAILEPELFMEQMIVDEKIGPSAEVAHRKAMEEYPGAFLLRKGWKEQIDAMTNATMRHQVAKYLLRGTTGRNEVTMIWHIVKTIGGRQVVIPCKARCDRFIEAFEPFPGAGEVSGIVDIKSTRDSSYDGMEKSIANFGYHRQAAWYLTGAVKCGLIDKFHDHSYTIVAIEKSAPYPVGVYPIAVSALKYGLDECVAGLRAYVKYRTLGHAPGPTDSTHPIGLPNWAMKAGNEAPFNNGDDNE